MSLSAGPGLSNPHRHSRKTPKDVAVQVQWFVMNPYYVSTYSTYIKIERENSAAKNQTRNSRNVGKFVKECIWPNASSAANQKIIIKLFHSTQCFGLNIVLQFEQWTTGLILYPLKTISGSLYHLNLELHFGQIDIFYLCLFITLSWQVRGRFSRASSSSPMLCWFDYLDKVKFKIQTCLWLLVATFTTFI